ncbi:polysaccharide biosynthesis/export family protein, partial [Steroidobacter sp.]|uniref:polysaccharide biosynthesis/export family protein n=1 Tax=Steroidobacter sp. TaxID=1978227 RepID=UPI001A3EF8B1
MLNTRLANRGLWLAAIAAAFLCSVLATVPVSAQTPSAGQLEMFQNMTPEQQKTILEAMGGSGTGTTTSPRTGVRSDSKLDFPSTVRSRSLNGKDEDGDDASSLDGVNGRKRLKGGDTVLLTLEIRQLKRRAPEIEEKERREQSAARQPGIPGAVQLPQNSGASGQNSTPQSQETLERSSDEQLRLEDFRERVLRRNPYKLDKWGILNVAELGPIPLAGLTEEEATQRLAAELRLNDFIVSLTRLPLKPLGTQALKPFGYDLFAGAPSTFAPVTDVPVSSEYVVGPGDRLQVQLIGNTKGRYELVVGRDGRISFPELGPIAVGGQRYDDVRNTLEKQVSEQLINTQVSVSMGELRSIRIFVLGDAETPGSYTVSGLSTITNALFVSGGVKPIGSLRNIQLKRAGRTVTTLDLYDLLLKGDTTADARLLPGDVIFIPPVGATVGIAGEVRRPAIYELKQETSAADLLQLAG